LSNKPEILKGLVVAAYGKRYQVELSDKTKLSCVTRGKKTDLACGDIVNIKQTDRGEGVVESSEERTSLLYRSNTFKNKTIAANVTQMIIVLATQPSFYEALLNRCLIAAEAANIKPLIILNKCDLSEANDAKNKLKTYEALAYDVVYLAAKKDITPLTAYLNNHQSVLVGQSGMGKSTIINALLPNENVRTQEVSSTLDSGKHTTTAAHLYHLNDSSTLIDSPGLQEFGLNHLGHCRFSDCKHQHEPDCAIIGGEKSGKISSVRLQFYQQFLQELSST